MTLDDLKARAETFFEWPDPAQKRTVTTTSAILFAHAMVQQAASDPGESRQHADSLADHLDDALDLADPDGEDDSLHAARSVLREYRLFQLLRAGQTDLFAE